MENSARLRVGVIIDQRELAEWQVRALHTLRNHADFFIYNCQNPSSAPRRARHAFYYLLNLFTIRNALTKRVSWPADLQAEAERDFDALQEGAWQALPANLLEQLRDDRIDVIVKFGMGLLRVPPADDLPTPILSYHHGDPAAFRGRPAGFYETLTGMPVMGQVVQRLSNMLDAGDIMAFAETKVLAHSYRSTLIEAYRHSPLILTKAIANCLSGRSWVPPEWGQNYRLPSNQLVLKFVGRQWRRTAAHFFYGLFKEKRWNIATVGLAPDAPLESITSSISQPSNWRPLPIPNGYRFLADPFFHPDGGLLVEGLNAKTSRGEILHLANGDYRRLSGRGGHYSYPATVVDGDDWHVVPEVSEWTPTKLYRLETNGLKAPLELRVPGRPRLLDPTPFVRNGRLYLFANRADEGPSVLRLWMAKNARAEFTEHPSSPIRLSPHGGRMGGSILQLDGKMIRVGQDMRGAYGDGLAFFRIATIDPQSYVEEHVRDFHFGHCKGPHTLNVSDGIAAFDHYRDVITPLAGIRRLIERRAARSPD